jgi:hypothetical protein
LPFERIQDQKAPFEKKGTKKLTNHETGNVLIFAFYDSRIMVVKVALTTTI